MTDDDHKRRATPRPGILAPFRERTSPAAMASGDGRGVESLTPPQGVPLHVDDIELSTPVIVSTPALSRTRTDSEPPRMTEDEYRRHLTAERKRFERALELTDRRVDAVAERVGQLQVANADTKARLQRIDDDRGEFASLAEFREWTTTRVVDLSGKDGTNGKVGTLRARLDGIDKAAEQSGTRRWSIIMLALGLLTSAGGVVAWSVRNVAELRSEVTYLRRDIDRADARPSIQEPQP